MTSENISRYIEPQQWILYDMASIVDRLVEAKTAAGILRGLPYLPQWIEQVHEEQLRLEAVGTSRIEGAEFSLREQEQALAPEPAIGSAEDGHWSNLVRASPLTRSQRQLRAADATYRWLRSQPAHRPVDSSFILDIHRRIVTGCDDDNCEPGALRPARSNVTFGWPRCRGAEGGDDCRFAFGGLCEAIAGEFRPHDEIIQALATHYHIGAIHPFADGNGRTARATEAFMLRRAGVSDLVMVSLSNYYYVHQGDYRAALSQCRQRNHDLAPFLRFALPAVAERCNAVAGEIIDNHKRTLYRQFATSLFGKLRSRRRRALAGRQMQMLEVLLERGPTHLFDLLDLCKPHYASLRFPERAQVRDLRGLINLDAVEFEEPNIRVNLDWPQQTSETALLEQLEGLPSATSADHPAMAELSQLLNRRR